jgi:hypothetical protein
MRLDALRGVIAALQMGSLTLYKRQANSIITLYPSSDTSTVKLSTHHRKDCALLNRAS